MRAATGIVTPPSTWTAARRKADGKPFFFIPSCKGAEVYMTAVDACTCPSAQNSRTGDCKHQAAVRKHCGIVAPAPKARPSYADLFDTCRDCGDLADGADSRCSKCASDREFAQRRESQRAAVAGR